MSSCSRSSKIVDRKSSLALTTIGVTHGPRVFYFHGASGAPDECRVFDEARKTHSFRFICVDWFAIDASIDGDSHFQFLAD
jgi:hypothetical protein